MIMNWICNKTQVWANGKQCAEERKEKVYLSMNHTKTPKTANVKMLLQQNWLSLKQAYKVHVPYFHERKYVQVW